MNQIGSSCCGKCACTVSWRFLHLFADSIQTLGHTYSTAHLIGPIVLSSHWGRVTHTCHRNLTTIDSDNGLSPGRRQAIIWTNAGILLTWPLETIFNEILTEIYAFSFKKIHFKTASGKWWPFCLGLVLSSWHSYVATVFQHLWHISSYISSWEFVSSFKDNRHQAFNPTMNFNPTMKK